MRVQERMGPKDLKSKSKDNPFEAVFAKGRKEKWGWEGAGGGRGDLGWRYEKPFLCRWECPGREGKLRWERNRPTRAGTMSRSWREGAGVSVEMGGTPRVTRERAKQGPETRWGSGGR